MGPWPRMRVKYAALGAAIAAALFATVVHAKPWKKWAPDPLASDSSYTMFLARPSDSLTAAQLSWLAVQRDWRAQRDAETESSPSRSITVTGHARAARRTDARFAALASRPYAALADTDRAWLVAENAAQRVARETPDGLGVMGFVLFAVLAVALAGAAAVAGEMNHGYYP